MKSSASKMFGKSGAMTIKATNKKKIQFLSPKALPRSPSGFGGEK